MKFSSFPERQKDDKAIKDLCDAYALAWYSGIPFREIVAAARKKYPDYAKRAEAMTGSPFLDQASHHLGVDKATIARVLSEFHK